MKLRRVDTKTGPGPGAPKGTTTYTWYPDGSESKEENLLAWAAEADGGWDCYPIGAEVTKVFDGKKLHFDSEVEIVAQTEKALSLLQLDPTRMG